VFRTTAVPLETAKKVTAHLSNENEIVVVPVESRLQTSQRDSHGLYPHELLMLQYARGFKSGQMDFQGFWWYQYGVRHPENILSYLEERKFIALGGVREAIEARTASSLKKALADCSLKQSGRKSELVDRLCDSVPTNELLLLFPERLFVLKSAGASALEDSEYVMYIHRYHRFDLDIFSFAEIVNGNPGRDFRELLLEYGQKKAQQFASENNWGLHRNVKYDAAEILAEKGRLRDAILMMTDVVYWDLSGMGNNFDMKYLRIMAPYLFPYEGSLARIAPMVIELIFKWARQSGISDPELRTLMLDHLSTMSSAIKLFTPEESVEITFLERFADVAKLTSVYGDAQNRFLSSHPNL
jgi:hypothetical protein